MFFTTRSVEATCVLCTMCQGFSFGAVGQVVAESQADWAVVAKLPKAGLQLLGGNAESVDAGSLFWEMKINVKDKKKVYIFFK